MNTLVLTLVVIAEAASGCSSAPPSCATSRADDPPALTVEHLIKADAMHQGDAALQCVRDAERLDASKYLLDSVCGAFTIADSKIDGERATVRVRCAADQDLIPYGLVRDRGVWKVDVAETRRLSQEDFEHDLRAKGMTDSQLETARGFIKDPPAPRDAAPD